MDFDLPSHHQNTHMNITVLVVDADPISLAIISKMLKTSTYIGKSFGEITVMTANDSLEALSTLRCQSNNIDVVITDYHMPGLNGVQLKRRINEEFGNFPVIVISAEMNNEIEQETLSSGEMCFMRKPIKPNDLDTICKHALNHKINGNFVLTNDNDNPIVLLGGSNEIQKTNLTSNPDDGSSGAKATKKSKITWTGALENHFCKAIQHIGVHKATPKKILEFMDLNYLTKAHVASKLQKYRKSLKEVKDDSGKKKRRAMISNIRSSSYINPQRSYNYKTSLSNNNNLFSSQHGYGDLGQSSHTMNNNAGFHGFDNYMNHRPTYNLSQTGSNFLPTRGMIYLKEKMESMSGTSQESQACKYEQYRIRSDLLGINSNLTTSTKNSNYSGLRIDEKGVLFGPGRIRVNDNDNAFLGGMQVTGNGNGSLAGIRVHATSNGSTSGTRVQGHGNGFLDEIRFHGINNGSLGGTRIQGNGSDFFDGIQVHGNHNGSLGEIRVHGNDSLSGNYFNSAVNGNGSLNGVIVQGNSNANGSVGGMGAHRTGSCSLGGIQVHGAGHGNASLGENLGGMNWNFNYNNMNNHGCSTSKFPSPLSSFLDNVDQSHNYLNAQTGGVVPLLQNTIISNDHHGSNNFFCNTINSQLDQNQRQGKTTGENPEVSTSYPLENLSNLSFNNDNYNEETLNSLAANSEMYFPTDQNMMNITNQELRVEDLRELPYSFDQDYDDENFLKNLLEDDKN